MQKFVFIFGFCLSAVNLLAAGLDLTFFGYKVCDISFDANPFSREDGRSTGIYVPHHSPQYYIPPPPSRPRPQPCAASKSNTRGDEKAIVVKDSSHVTIINHENQQRNRPVYAPSIQATYPVRYYYASPTVYTYPAYCTYPAYYTYPYCYYRW